MNQALVSMKVYTHGGLALLRNIVAELDKDFTVSSASSIYKVQRVFQNSRDLHDLRNSEIFEGLCAVCSVNTNQGVSQVGKVIRQIEESFVKSRSEKSVSLNLLVFEKEHLSMPDLTVPHPEFHLKPEEVVPSAEVWGEYRHPILDKSLNDLAQAFSGHAWGEFYAQGKSLLDF